MTKKPLPPEIIIAQATLALERAIKIGSSASAKKCIDALSAGAYVDKKMVGKACRRFHLCTPQVLGALFTKANLSIKDQGKIMLLALDQHTKASDVLMPLLTNFDWLDANHFQSDKTAKLINKHIASLPEDIQEKIVKNFQGEVWGSKQDVLSDVYPNIKRVCEKFRIQEELKGSHTSAPRLKM